MQSALERLEVVENGLSLDGDPPSTAFDDEIPRSQITANGQWDLGQASKTRVDVGPKTIEQPLLTCVADRIACRVAANDQIEPNRRTPGADFLDGDVIDPATLETEELLMRCAGRRGNCAQAQSGADPGRTSIAAQQLERFVGSTPAAIRRPLSRAHPAILMPGDLLAVIGLDRDRLRLSSHAGRVRGPSDGRTAGMSRFQAGQSSFGPRQGPRVG